MNIATSHNRYLDPPDGPPCCDDCGEVLIYDPYDREVSCANEKCPSKFDGIEKEMAQEIVELRESLKSAHGMLERATMMGFHKGAVADVNQIIGVVKERNQFLRRVGELEKEIKMLKGKV